MYIHTYILIDRTIDNNNNNNRGKGSKGSSRGNNVLTCSLARGIMSQLMGLLQIVL